MSIMDTRNPTNTGSRIKPPHPLRWRAKKWLAAHPKIRRIIRDLVRKVKKIQLDINSFQTRMRQKKLLVSSYSPQVQRLIMFLSPGNDIINGGILSITSLYNETCKIAKNLGAEVIMCNEPGQPNLIRYSKFHNQNYMYDMEQALSYFTNVNRIMIHIPEYAVGRFVTAIGRERRERFREIGDVHLNVLLQDIHVVPNRGDIDKLKEIGKVTCTTAHERYSTSRIRDGLGCPVHKLSVYLSPEQYHRAPYQDKNDLLIVSPDIHPMRDSILDAIRKTFPNLTVRVVKNLTPEEYTALLQRAKWGLTFGEGLDGWFIETIFSGGIAFAVYNTEFFTDDFKSLRTVYADYNDLSQKICSDLRELDEAAHFTDYQNEEHALCARHYDFREYVKNLELFYQGEYTFK